MFKILTPSKTSKGQVAGESQKGKYTPLRDSAENLGSPGETKASELHKKNAKKTDKEESGSPIKQLGNNIKRGTQKIGNNFRTSIRKGKKKVEQKIPDDEEAVPQKGMIRPLEENLPAAVSSPKLSRHSTRENLSTIGKQGEESEKQEEKPDSHGDSDSEMDLSAIASEPLRHLTKARSQRPSGQRPSAKHQSKISAKETATASIVRTPSERSINSILSDLEDEENREDSPQLIQEQEPQEKPIAYSLDHHEDSGIDLFEEKKDSEEKLEITPQIVNLEPEEAVKETPIKKQPSDKNPNVTLAICCLAACCFIAAADKESGMLCLIGAAFLIAAIVIEWQTPPPSRELTYPSSSPFIDNKAVAKP